MNKANKVLNLMEAWGYVEVHSSGFPLRTSSSYENREEAVSDANRAYRTAVNTGNAAGIRFGVIYDKGNVKGKLVMTKSWRKHPAGPFS